MKYTIHLLISSLFFACSLSSEEQKSNATTTASDQVNQKAEWLTAFNDDLSLDSFYLEDAVIALDNGSFYQDESDRTSYFKNLKDTIGNLQYGRTFFHTTTVNDIEYELGEWVSENKSFYRFLRIKDAKGLRALEFYTGGDLNHELDYGEIDTARAKWMELCNQHDAAELVEQLYTDNAIYYNHKPVLIGTESIAVEYSYMNNPDYSLKLVPLTVEPANKNIVFEIGQCSGSYNGKYVLIWKKVADGVWKILLDSNV
ncbi:MAG: hypothetical protein AAF806_29525 [Bacteroidota bacterium]